MDEQSPDFSILNQDYKNTQCEFYLNDPTDLPEIPIEAGSFAPYANATSHAKLMLQHWGNRKAWDFFCSKADPNSFNLIVRIRPDLWIHRFREPYGPYYELDPKAAILPWWGKFGGVNDRLALLGPEAAKAYFNVYDAIPELLSKGCPFHPETLVMEALKAEGCAVYSSLMTEFSTMRMDGSQRWAEITMSDMAEFIASK